MTQVACPHCGAKLDLVLLMLDRPSSVGNPAPAALPGSTNPTVSVPSEAGPARTFSAGPCKWCGKPVELTFPPAKKLYVCTACYKEGRR